MNTQENMNLTQQLENVKTEKKIREDVTEGSNLTKVEEAFIDKVTDETPELIAQVVLKEYTRLQRTQWMKEIRRTERLLTENLITVDVTIEDLKEATNILIDLKYDKI